MFLARIWKTLTSADRKRNWNPMRFSRLACSNNQITVHSSQESRLWMRKEPSWYRLVSAIRFKLAFKPGGYFSAFDCQWVSQWSCTVTTENQGKGQDLDGKKANNGWVMRPTVSKISCTFFSPCDWFFSVARHKIWIIRRVILSNRNHAKAECGSRY